MTKLTMMMGIPGSGKSTWAKAHVNEDTVLISRDEIRFSLLKEGEDYFAHETEVMQIFIDKIIDAMFLHNKNVIVDATHLTKKSRAKVLSKVSRFSDETVAVWLNPSLETAIARNDFREGRAWVKHGIIRRMFFQMEPPCKEEGFDKIFVIEV